jgi:hypothetical protein
VGRGALRQRRARRAAPLLRRINGGLARRLCSANKLQKLLAPSPLLVAKPRLLLLLLHVLYKRL